MVGPADVERMFRDAGALREGHFVLASGRHSPGYLDKFQVLQHPGDTERLCAAIASWARPLRVDIVAGPTTGGVILAHEVARQLGARAIYAERSEAASGREFRRGFAIESGERVLVVDDIITTGGSLRETIAAVTSAGGTVVAAAVLVDRSGDSARLDVPLHALWHLQIPAYAPAECPLCAKGVPATHPGTSPARAGAAR
ncbi:MAG TPA: orotate phosphoribosyltransferase [Candidatus Limnocylindria bacterium]|nr:orotate phosphoribosyltransferase [Candidatus Limnocylindria bacterium]